MNPEILFKLLALPRLDRANAARCNVPCKICGSSAAFCDLVDFNKHAGGHLFGPSGIAVPWYRCGDCGYLFTSFFDDWTPENFSKFVYNEDYILVDPSYASQRPAAQAEAFPRLLGPPCGMRILDYGSGAGIFVNGLVERGYHASGYDPFSSPQRPEGLFDLIFCMEVLEHSPDPMAVLRDMRSLLREGGGILLGQSLQPPDIVDLRANWWYCAPRNGHCSTFTERSLTRAAEQIGLRFHQGPGRHAFTPAAGGPVATLLQSMTGPPLATTTLGAPGDIQAPGWHGIERSPVAPFRWTALASIKWRVAVGGAERLDVHIPVYNAVHPSFLRECQIKVEGHETTTQIKKDELVAQIADLRPKDDIVMVELRTPEPQSPRNVRGAPDDRLLGLAIPVR